jgi:hypothetical protein
MYLKKLIADNFRLLENFEIEFRPDVTVLVGPNYVGKSSVIEAILATARGVVSNNLSLPFAKGVSRQDLQRRLSVELQLVEEDGSRFSHVAELTAAGFMGWRVCADTQPLHRQAIPPKLLDFFSTVANVDAFGNVQFFANVAPKETIAVTGFDLPQILHYNIRTIARDSMAMSRMLLKFFPISTSLKHP